MNTNITVVGIGYVGLSIATLLSQKNFVVAVDISEEKVTAVNQRISPIDDEYIKKYFAEKVLNLTATIDFVSSYENADFIIVAVPTNYSPEKNFFDTSVLESIIEKIINSNSNSVIVIKSTVPIGFTKSMRKNFFTNNIIVSPEFLRESTALYDNLYPSRIIIGTDSNDRNQLKIAEKFADLLKESAVKTNIPTLITGITEAEAIKLFTNTYLALRVAYFNELDTYAEIKGLNAKDMIEGICYDSRIGDYYNNPSFGYGGYCLPKDTKQLLADYQDVPENLIKSVVKSNETRKSFIVDRILKLISSGETGNNLRYDKKEIVIGFYRFTMKFGSDNFRQSSVHEIMTRLQAEGLTIIAYEPLLDDGQIFFGTKIVNDISRFKKISDHIIANRYDSVLDDVTDKVYTRDLFHRD